MCRISDVEIRPHDSLVVAGNTLELNCTISGFARNVTSDLIHFWPERPIELGGQRVDVIDNVTSRLGYPGVQRAENMGHVFCNVGDFEEYDHVSFRVAGIHRIQHSHQHLLMPIRYCSNVILRLMRCLHYYESLKLFPVSSQYSVYISRVYHRRQY